MNNINSGELQNLIIPLCNIAEQRVVLDRLDEKLSLVDQMQLEINQQLLKAESLRQSILRRAFSGKLVSQDPSDEPASVLLERIKTERQRRKKSNKYKRKDAA